MTKYIVHAFFLIIILLTSCSGCSRSGKNRMREEMNSQNYSSERGSSESQPRIKGKYTVQMVKVSGVYEIPITINDVEMKFILDTGASYISISSTEAMFLYKQGKLKKTDILGKIDLQNANGAISEGTVINLEKVKIGNLELNNVKATVIQNLEAPLLLGQTALERFGKVTIDYKNQVITFE